MNQRHSWLDDKPNVVYTSIWWLVDRQCKDLLIELPSSQTGPGPTPSSVTAAKHSTDQLIMPVGNSNVTLHTSTNITALSDKCSASNINWI